MCKKSILLVLVALFCLISSAHAQNIVWVGELDDQDGDGVVDDSEWVPWLLEQGYSVDYQPENWLTLNAAKLEALNSADLIIVSRNTDSDAYANGNEPSQWNSITTPMIMITSYLPRSNRWQWVTHQDTPFMDPVWEAVIPSHPVFFGVGLGASNQVLALDVSKPSGGTAHLGPDVGNGLVIARVPGSGEVGIVEWEPGIEYNPGGPIVAGRRLLFTAGTTEAGGNPQGMFNLTPAGEQMFLNAIKYMLGVSFEAAYNPSPETEEVDVLRDVILSWTPGPYAATHDVYFGTIFDDVDNASRTNQLGVLLNQDQDANTYDPGRLEFSQRYFWRVDEVDAPPSSTIYKGDVWSFTVEPFSYPIPSDSIVATASSQAGNQGPENTVNGLGLVDELHSASPADMWLSSKSEPGSAWIQYEFSTLYKLDQMHVWNYNGNAILALYGLKEVTIEYSTDGSTWAQVDNVTELAQATGTEGYAHNTTISFDGAAAKYVKITANGNWGGGGFFDQYGLSEVRFMHIPVGARKPNPEPGATDVAVETTFSWRAGREAAEHHVYLSTDRQAVVDGTESASIANQPNYRPSALDLGSTYYWRVDEVNNAETLTTWPGDLWNFSTQEYLIVDDFESYNDIPSGEEGSKLVYETWIDGFANPSANGSTIGYVSGNSMETQNVHDGAQSVPLIYDNTSASVSEVTVNINNLEIGSDWSKGSPGTMVLWVQGDPGNASTERMYIKLNSTKIVYNGNIADSRWKQWNIDLAASGVNLTNVSSLSIGFEKTGATGGSGMVFVDEIRLYRSAPEVVVPSEEIWIEAESVAAVPNYWEVLSDMADASGGMYLGVKAGNNSTANPPQADGIVSYTFSVQGGTYVVSTRAIVPTADDNSLWVNIPGATMQTDVHASGWVRWYDIATGSSWHWDTVRSWEDNNQVVQFTMPAGTYTLEIAYREDGLLLDTFVITSLDL